MFEGQEPSGGERVDEENPPDELQEAVRGRGAAGSGAAAGTDKIGEDAVKEQTTVRAPDEDAGAGGETEDRPGA